ncbi:hypothetical protein [Mycoplasma sp. E35C]|uniref:hypothetical protein n=1 Tax=Mycoplasma sp. E35C TaxID=2801918 RepID=UPI001CA39BB5|nr:hypothetical protein [Mycoplasma sp. E35C]QZX49050.1 hypothetical protein JJE79_03265 [Mycoplasma sp. E35C]
MKKISKGKISLISVGAVAVTATAIATPLAVASKNTEPTQKIKKDMKNADLSDPAINDPSLNGPNGLDENSSFLPKLGDNDNSKEGVIVVESEKQPSTTTVTPVSENNKEENGVAIPGLPTSSGPINSVNGKNPFLTNNNSTVAKIDEGNLAKIISSTVGTVLGASLAGISVLAYNWKNPSNKAKVPTSIDLKNRPNEVELSNLPIQSPSTTNSLLTQGRELQELEINFSKENKSRKYLLPSDWFVSMNNGFNSGIVNTDFNDFVKYLRANPDQLENKLAFLTYLDKNPNSPKHFQSNLNDVDQEIEKLFSFLDDEKYKSNNTSANNSVRVPNLSSKPDADNNISIRSTKETRKATKDPVTALNASYEQYLGQKIQDPKKEPVLTSSNELEDAANRLVKGYMNYTTKSDKGTVSSDDVNTLIGNYYRFVSKSKESSTDDFLTLKDNSRSSSKLNLDQVFDELKSDGSSSKIKANKITNISEQLKTALAWKDPVAAKPNHLSYANVENLTKLVNEDESIKSAAGYKKVPRDKSGRPIISDPFNLVATSFLTTNPHALSEGYIYVTTTRDNSITQKREVRSYFVPESLLSKENKPFFETSLKLLWTDPSTKNNPYSFIQKFDEIKRVNPNQYILPKYDVIDEDGLNYASLSFDTFKDTNTRAKVAEALKNRSSETIYSSIKIDNNKVEVKPITSDKRTVSSISKLFSTNDDIIKRRQIELENPYSEINLSAKSSIGSKQSQSIASELAKSNTTSISSKLSLKLKGLFRPTVDKNSVSKSTVIKTGVLKKLRNRVSNFFSSTANFFKTKFAFLRR